MWRAWAAGGGSLGGADRPEGSSVPALAAAGGEPYGGLRLLPPVPANGPTAAWSAPVQSGMVTSGSSSRTAAATGIASGWIAGKGLRLARQRRVAPSTSQGQGSPAPGPGPGIVVTPAPAHDSGAPLLVWPPGSQTGHSAPLGHGDLAIGRQRIVGREYVD